MFYVYRKFKKNNIKKYIDLSKSSLRNKKLKLLSGFVTICLIIIDKQM